MPHYAGYSQIKFQFQKRLSLSPYSPRRVERRDPDVVPRGRLEPLDAARTFPRGHVARDELEVVLRLAPVLDDEILDGAAAVAEGVQPQSHRRPVGQDEVGEVGDVRYCKIN